MSGLSRVQCSLVPVTDPLPADDPHLEKLEWRDARILPPPASWGGGLPEGKLPPVPLQFDPATGGPRAWPLRYALVQWTAALVAPSAGSCRLRCRAVDANGIAQPLPRPFPRSGNNRIQEVAVTVEG